MTGDAEHKASMLQLVNNQSSQPYLANTKSRKQFILSKLMQFSEITKRIICVMNKVRAIINMTEMQKCINMFNGLLAT